MSGVARCPGSGSMDELEELRVEKAKIGAKFGRFCGRKLRKRWGKARSTCNTRNPRIKSNETSSHQQITKKIGAIFVGIFEIGEEHNKIRLENKG
jgi:hypothetical protein